MADVGAVVHAAKVDFSGGGVGSVDGFSECGGAGGDAQDAASAGDEIVSVQFGASVENRCAGGFGFGNAVDDVACSRGIGVVFGS